MKIVLSSQGCHKRDLVDVRFGRCHYFAIYDVEENSFEFISNDGAGDNQGAGVSAAQMVLDIQPEALLTERLGPKAFDILKKSSIKMYRCHGMSLEDAVERYKNENLELIEASYT